MKSKKTLVAIPLMAIAAIAIGFAMTGNVFAQPNAATTPVDQPDSPNDKDNIQAGDQASNDAAGTADNGADSQNDVETADDHNNASQASNGDGEQNDQTELKK